MRQHAFQHAARAMVLALVLFLSLGQTKPAATSTAPSFTFFVIGDPQINLPKWGTAGTDKTIQMMNELAGTDFPAAAGGGKVDKPRALLILGDLVDDLNNPENWKLYTDRFDPHGKATLKIPVIEGVGNHDLDFALKGPQLSVIQKAVIDRNKLRTPEETGTKNFNYDAIGYHYSWDWDQIHFVHLNVFPGTVWRPVYDRPTEWNDPQHALEFLAKDLKEQVGDSGRPVIIMWHYGLRGWGLEKWWLPEDLANLKKTIAPYNMLLILHGHEHAYARYQWEGYDVMMAPSPQKDREPPEAPVESTPKGFVVMRVRDNMLETALRTPAGWSEIWTKKITGPAAK